MEDFSAKVEFRTSKAQEARFKALCKREMIAPSTMARILFKEALNQRECSDLAHQADTHEHHIDGVPVGDFAEQVQGAIDEYRGKSE